MTKKEPDVRYERQYDKRGKGYLEIYVRSYPGVLHQPDERFFVYSSLKDVLGVTQSHLNNQYIRANMAAKVEFIPTGHGRPVRAFPLSTLEVIERMVTNPELGDRFELPPKTNPRIVRNVGGIPHVEFKGHHYYTYETLCEAFYMSDSTVRKHLNRTGLMEFFTNISERGAPGRPRRGIPVSFEKAIRAVFEQGFDEQDLRVHGLLPGSQAHAKLESEARRLGKVVVDPDELGVANEEFAYNVAVLAMRTLVHKMGEEVADFERVLDGIAVQAVGDVLHGESDEPVNTVNPDTPPPSAVQDIDDEPVVDPEITSNLMKELEALGMNV